MANILVLTNIYPLNDVKLYGTTSVCHYFVKEWHNKGNNIRVIYNYTIYTRILHWLAKKYADIICSILPTVINSERFNTFEYDYEGVKVLLNPVYKFLPKFPFAKKQLRKTITRITRWLQKEQFKPDIVVGHFLHPNIDLLPALKSLYNCPTVIITHGKYNTRTDKAIAEVTSMQIDSWGFRSIPIQNSFKAIIKNNHQFLCFSGVPENFIDENSWIKHNTEQVSKFLFTGNLIKRKHPLTVVKAFSSIAHHNENLTIIGTGAQSKIITEYIIDNHLSNQISLSGRLSRDEVRNCMLKNEVFVMISSDETFGLVYLEAMACGCIVIASRDEGMDGIITDGVNGFLCEAGNEQELESIFNKIKRLKTSEKINISKNAINTAKQMTDKAMADEYYYQIQQLIINL